MKREEKCPQGREIEKRREKKGRLIGWLMSITIWINVQSTYIVVQPS
jgi:hypothetical protein